MTAVTPPLSVREFAETNASRLTALCISMAGNEHDGWDLVQGTLERMARALSRSTPDDPWAYAVRVATNLNIDRIRKARRENVRARVDPSTPLVSLPDELNPWLWAALRRLTPRQRTALALRYLDDLSISQIADLMSTSEGTVRTHLSRGGERLRSLAHSIGPNTWSDE